MNREQLIEIADQRGRVTVAQVQAYFDQEDGPGVFTVQAVVHHRLQPGVCGLTAILQPLTPDEGPWSLEPGAFTTTEDHQP